MGFNKPPPPPNSLAWHRKHHQDIVVWCLRCHHRRAFKPQQLHRWIEWGDPPWIAIKQFRCSRCGAKDCTVT